VGNYIKLSSPQTHEYWEIPVLYEDDRLLVVDKPSRLLTSPDRYDPKRPNLMKLLQRDIARPAPWVMERGLTYLSNVHRLDFETSGALLLVKDKPALIDLANQFGANTPHKTYLSLAHGESSQDQFVAELPLAHHPLKPELMRVDFKKGKRSKTEFQAIERFRGYTLFQCRPLTGRTHQIRVHLQYLGYPIVADALYGGKKLLLSRLKRGYHLKPNEEERPLLGRLGLHAETLTIRHPTSKEPITLSAPLAKDFQVALKYLRRFAMAWSERSDGVQRAK